MRVPTPRPARRGAVWELGPHSPRWSPSDGQLGGRSLCGAGPKVTRPPSSRRERRKEVAASPGNTQSHKGAPCPSRPAGQGSPHSLHSPGHPQTCPEDRAAPFFLSRPPPSLLLTPGLRPCSPDTDHCFEAPFGLRELSHEPWLPRLPRASRRGDQGKEPGSGTQGTPPATSWVTPAGC